MCLAAKSLRPPVRNLNESPVAYQLCTPILLYKKRSEKQGEYFNTRHSEEKSSQLLHWSTNHKANLSMDTYVRQTPL